jgi:CHAD domain-containing protein
MTAPGVSGGWRLPFVGDRPPRRRRRNRADTEVEGAGPMRIMTHCLQTRESSVLELRAAVCRQLEKAHAESTGAAMDADEAVHAVRKRFKKIRAILRLLKSELGDRYTEEKTWYRDRGRDLSAGRDASTLLEALEALQKRYPRRFAQSPAASVREWLESRRQTLGNDLSETLGATADRHGEARARLEEWPPCLMDFDALAPGLRKGYARGRKALQQAADEPLAEHFHELRKRVKDHWYHCRLLEPVIRGRMKSRHRSLRRLAEWLGEDHDLAVLRETLTLEAAGLGGIESLDSLFGLIDHRSAELRKEARKASEQLYGERPGEFIENLRHRWKGNGSEI